MCSEVEKYQSLLKMVQKKDWMMTFRSKNDRDKKKYYDKWIQKGVVNPNDPRESSAAGGTGPLNNHTASTKKLN